MGALDLVAKAAKGAKKAAPFFSKADVLLDELQRGKGTGNEFLTELVKKGAKPTELKERGLEAALKDRPKMTKAEVQKVFEEKAPPKVQEKVLKSNAPDYDEWLENKAQEVYGVDWFDLRLDEQRALEKMYGNLPVAQYEQYKTPGGENYREILLKLPQAKSERDIADENMKAFTDKVTDRLGFKSWDFNDMSPSELMEYEVLNNAALKASTEKPKPYVSSHYRDDPNLLAHIRVQDFKTPEGKKVLLVDEIQSDWHQTGRRSGYKNEATEKQTEGLKKEISNLGDRRRNLELEAGKLNNTGIRFLEVMDELDGIDKKMKGLTKQYMDALETLKNGVPDAPFKKNWHELAMKRVLDYAAENGYDTVAITPGVQQVKRYEDATRQAVDEVAMYGDTLVGFKNGRRVIEQPISSPDELEKYIGKDMAQKLSSAAPDMNFIRSIKGDDLTVGGEGMKGFYDKILPDYLNNYGKQYGSSVGQIQLPTGTEMSRGASGSDMVPTYTPTMQGFHSFDITPQMREEIKTKGLPLYSKMGIGPEGLAVGSGAATIGANIPTGEDEQSVQNPVHFTENPDAMHLELTKRN